MATILDKKYTAKDSSSDILGAIVVLATDKHSRITWEDQNRWLETKLKEIARLAKLASQKVKP